jgi:hypothetical protein
MATYIVDFYSLGTETSPTIPGKANISLPPNTVNSTATSLDLTGQGVSLYGEYQQQNFLRLLEHFASKTAPLHPTVGQIWFNSSRNTLLVYDMNEEWVDIGNGVYITITEPGDAVEGRLWYHVTENILYLRINPAGPYSGKTRYYGGRWVQVWPHVVPYAGAVEYNVLAARINQVIGSPTTTGADSDIAMNEWGWGETDVLPIFSTANSPTSFDNNAWVVLLSRLRKALRHVDQTLAPEADAGQFGYIWDGRGANNATAATYSPAVTWNYGWGGCGIVSQAIRYADTVDAIEALEDNRFTINTLDTTLTTLNTTSRPDWNTTKVYECSVQFTTQTAARRFFNTAGYLRFNITNVGGTANALKTAWVNVFTNNSTNVDDFSTAGFVLDWKGCKLGPSGSYIGGSSSVGYYDLTTSYVTLHSVARSGAYGTGTLLFEAKTSTAGGWTVDVRITFTEDTNVGSPSVTGTTAVVLQIRTPTGIISGSPTVNTPAITLPTASTSGSFVTAPAE